ncbi:hypothetical protein [Geodermatophilus maliterrae]|uniref:Uncharacterized protein n=1 Tax=Geodermatophilus maliterrae TaxID=3162531 RepID=A0ABV3XA80_9ACTN
MSALADADRDGIHARGEDDPSGAHRPRGRHRVVIGYLVVAAILPYLLLKAAWIAGSTIGFATESSVDPGVLLGGNILTAGMELVAIVVVLAFTHDWGMRLPAWLVLLPAWVGTGLLAPFVVAGPLVVLSVATAASPVGDGSFEPWVGPVVYSSFGAQALGIALTFALYARARWARLLRSRAGCRSAGPHPLLTPAVWIAAVLLAAVAAARLLWALDPAAAASFGLTDARGTTERAADAGAAAFALMAAAGLLVLVRRRRARTPLWVPLALTWVGSGATWAGGWWPLLLWIGEVAGAGTSSPGAGLVAGVHLVQVIAGLLVARVGAVVLAGRGGAPGLSPGHRRRSVDARQ